MSFAAKGTSRGSDWCRTVAETGLRERNRFGIMSAVRKDLT